MAREHSFSFSGINLRKQESWCTKDPKHGQIVQLGHNTRYVHRTATAPGYVPPSFSFSRTEVSSSLPLLMCEVFNVPR